MLWLIEYGPAVVNVLTIETSADAAAVPPLPVLSVLLPGTGSGSVARSEERRVGKEGGARGAGTEMVAIGPTARLAMVQGRAAQPPPVTLVMVRFAGESETCTFVAMDGPALATKSV